VKEENPLFKYTKSEIAAKATELNFVRDTLEKVLRLSEILNYLNTNPLTKEHLVLKGGSAINLTVFNLPRLSVDIDLDFAQNLSRDDMMNTRERIREDIKIYMSTQGYAISPRSKAYHSLDSFVFTYTNLGGMNDNIKIEINYSLRAHIFEPSLRKLSVPGINTNSLISVLIPMELFAAKINALIGRAAARDLYDIHNMIKFSLFDESEFSLLRKCVVFYTAISQDDIPDEYDFKRFNAITSRKIKTDLLPVIQKGEFFELENAKTEVAEFLKELLVLEADDRKFLNEFKAKKYHPELLFDDTDILSRIKEHPMALWKMQNKG
jgi:predicted nucleotidyltransferase component of viral defense system